MPVQRTGTCSIRVPLKSFLRSNPSKRVPVAEGQRYVAKGFMRGQKHMRFLLLSILIILPRTGCDTLLCQDLHPEPAHGELTSKSQPSSKVRLTCDSLYYSILTIPKIIVYRTEGTFRDDNIRRDLTGCMIIISGSRSDLSGKPNPGDLIFKFLSDKGWLEKADYSADGPDGTSFAFSKYGIWCFVRGQWDGGDDADSTNVPGDIYQFIVHCTEFDDIGRK